MADPLTPTGALSLSRCTVCPRSCGANRLNSHFGSHNGNHFGSHCGAGDKIEVSKIMLHHWEEPCISGSSSDYGSGAVFFTHCPLGCAYCQNQSVSRRTSVGKIYSETELANALIELQARGAYNINLVSPTQYTPQLIEAVRIAKSGGLTLPIIWNTGGYELPETIAALADTVDIFLTDFKYASPETAQLYSSARDYPLHAAAALAQMHRITGKCEFDSEQMLRRGVIVRHLVLPNQRHDSIKVLQIIAKTVPVDEVQLSLMAQYTPDFLPNDEKFAGLRRRITSFEYDSVLKEAIRLEFVGYSQAKNSASAKFTPNF